MILCYDSHNFIGFDSTGIDDCYLRSLVLTLKHHSFRDFMLKEGAETNGKDLYRR